MHIIKASGNGDPGARDGSINRFGTRAEKIMERLNDLLVGAFEHFSGELAGKL